LEVVGHVQYTTHDASLPAKKGAVSGGDLRFFVLMCAVLMCLAFAAYVPALRAGFVLGDDGWLTSNPAVRSAAGLRDIWLRPSALPQYSPLTFTSFWIEYRLWRLDPIGYHFDNVLFHAASAVLLYYLLKKLQVPAAWLAAALFAVHPINAESVAWIAHRQNVLSMLFYLLATLAYLRYVGVIGDASPGRWWLSAMAILSLICGLLANSMIAKWPLAMLLIIWWRNGRFSLRGVIPLFPATAIAIGAVVAARWIDESRGGGPGPESTWSFANGLIIAGRAFWFYVAKVLCPLRLCSIYPEWDIDAARAAQYLFPLAAVAAIVLLWLLRGRIGRGPVTAVLLFAVTLAPALGLFKIYTTPYSLVADRWVYHAGPAILALVAALLAEAARRVQWRRSVAGTAGCALVLVLTVLTIRRAGHFRDIETFWRAVIRCNPQAWVAQDNLGRYLLSQKRLPEAEQCLSVAVRLRPDDYVALTNLGLAFFGQNRPDEAIRQYRAALAVNPNYRLARNDLGLALFQKGQMDEAIRELQRAVDLQPRYAPAHQHLAMALEYKGAIEQAITHYEAALEAAPDNAVVRNNLAWLLATASEARLRDGPRAVDLARQACKETGWKVPNMLGTLAAALAETGDFEQALRVAKTGYQIASATGRNDLLKQMGPMIRSMENGQPIRLGSITASAPATSQAWQSGPAG
jgi:protein O-mannosyl-transferase